MGDETTEDLVLLRHHFVAKRNKREAEIKKKEAKRLEADKKKEEEGNGDVIDLD